MEYVFSDCHWVWWGCIATLAIPVSIIDVEMEIVIGVEAVHCVELGELTKHEIDKFHPNTITHQDT